MKARQSDHEGLRLARVHVRRPRLTAGTAAGVAAFVLLCFAGGLSWRMRLILAWDAGILVALVLLAGLRGADPATMKRIAATQDAGKWAVLLLTLAAAGTCLVAVAGEIAPTRDADELGKVLHLAFVVATIVLSWAFIHVTFALHYAHDYYSGARRAGHEGLVFPGNGAPNYMDFVYFSFTIGMTFQVSDVQITDRGFRGLVLAHGIVSFFYSTVILALAINLIAGAA
ncbi:MAG TPA: DUF1345 domain-containing protein [Burkholderiales bacterium]|nr:DUF1345 domain-containing protein [Burkholderiales bacterium]